MSERKWGRSKEIIRDLLSKFNDPNHLPEMDLKEMEWKTVFLVHMAMVHPSIMLFMRGIYLTMNSWCPNKDRDIWK